MFTKLKITSNHHESTSQEMNGHIRNEDTWKEVSISVPWGFVKGKWWGPRNKQPVIALHGWQDNAGSFDNLCPLLIPEIPIFCIDLPGHGFSSPYPNGMQYYLFWDGIALIRRIVRQHDWKNIILMGHSLGGAIAFMYASCFPNDISKLISIDMAGPTVRDYKKNVALIGSSIDKFLDYENLPENKIPCYSYNEMIDLVVKAYQGSVNEEGVKILMKRGMSAVSSDLNKTGYHFSRDLRLKVSSLAMFSLEQVLTFAERIECKVLNIRGDPGMDFENPEIYEKVIECMRKKAELVIYKKISGTHHLHLITPQSIQKDINDFLLL